MSSPPGVDQNRFSLLRGGDPNQNAKKRKVPAGRKEFTGLQSTVNFPPLVTKTTTTDDSKYIMISSRKLVGNQNKEGKSNYCRMEVFNIFTVLKALTAISQEIQDVDWRNDGRIQLLVKSKAVAEKFIRTTELQIIGDSNIPVHVEYVAALNTSRGVIASTVLKYVTEKDIIEDLSSQGVIAARQIRRQGTNEATGTVVLTFDHHTIPSYIKICGVKKKAHRNVEADLCSETRKVIKQQKLLAEKFKNAYSKESYGLSINDTLEALLNLGDLKLTEKFKNEYKIPDKRFWWLRIQILAKNSRWDELEKFSKSKKSPIGYEPFIEICLDNENIEEAKKYITKCREDKKVKWYMRAGLLDEAATIAFDQRDISSLQTIQILSVKNNKTNIAERVESLIIQLNSRK